MVRLAQERVLSADVREPPDEVRVHKAARQAHHPAQNPRDQDECGRMHDLGDVVRDHEDAGSDHAAHDQHRDVEQAERPGQRRVGIGRGIARFGDVGGNQLRVQGCLGRGAVLRCAGPLFPRRPARYGDSVRREYGCKISNTFFIYADSFTVKRSRHAVY